MAVAFTRLSYWLWGTNDPESINSAQNSSSDLPSGFREVDSIKFPAMNRSGLRSSSKRCKNKGRSREERTMRIDREHDAVIVPSDGGCLSGSESDDSDWSIGWMEPHSSDFQSDADDAENSFAVLVQCYGHGRCAKREIMKGRVLGAVTEFDGISPEGMDYIERWLSSLHNL